MKYSYLYLIRIYLKQYKFTWSKFKMDKKRYRNNPFKLKSDQSEVEHTMHWSPIWPGLQFPP